MNYVPIGLCDITIDGETYYSLGDDAYFRVQPTYETYRYGKMQKGYILTDYVVSFEFSLEQVNYDVLKMAMSVHEYGNGLYDDPSSINFQEGKQVIIHPVDLGNNKDYDITLFSAIVDPEQEFEKVYGRGVNPISIRLIALPHRSFNGSNFNSFYFIGDAEKAGVI